MRNNWFKRRLIRWFKINTMEVYIKDDLSGLKDITVRYVGRPVPHNVGCACSECQGKIGLD